MFRYQAAENPTYAQFIKNLRIAVDEVRYIDEIPFLPVEMFKKHRLISGNQHAEIVFTSSGTTGAESSKHEVADLGLYEQSFRTAFEQFYGKPQNLAILALLPAYLEREGSSLIYMVDHLMGESQFSESGYFLYDHDELGSTMLALKEKNTPTLLLGVTYALLDFADFLLANPSMREALSDFQKLSIMETGGMKGRRKEMIREEVHDYLCRTFNQTEIHSEYGMTELLSQAYSKGKGLFSTPPWMKILVRDPNDPLSYVRTGQSGGINVIDLANIHSCSFIATQDLGRMHPDGQFEVLGRFDHSDIRGCNLLIA